MITYAAALVLVLLFLSSAVKILNEYERGVVFRLGRVIGCKGPGLILLIPAIDKMVRVDLRVVAMDVPAQDVITRDNVTIKVSAVLYFRVIDPNRAIVGVENYLYATSQLSQTTLRSVCGQAELDELLASREKINTHLQEILDKDTEPWGVKVAKVEIKNIDLPQEMQRAIAKQAEAERERRAKVIGAEGEFQAAQKLSDAAKIIGENPIALQLRYLQTLREVAAENNSTTIFPVPIDLLTPFMQMAKMVTPAPAEGAMRLLPLFAAGILLLAGCAGAPRTVPPPAGAPIPPRAANRRPVAGAPAAPPRSGPATSRPHLPKSPGPGSSVCSCREGHRKSSSKGKRSGRGASTGGWPPKRRVASPSPRSGNGSDGTGRGSSATPLMRRGRRTCASGTGKGPDGSASSRRKGELLAVAVVPLEAYVAAVLSREAGPRFHPEALAALAVAVRTYAVGAAAKPRDPAYDVVGGVEDQVFDGMDGVAAVFREAADRTRGVVVRYRGELALTVYHSTCGGRTEDAGSAWGKDVPYLRAQLCDDCADSPVYRWEYRMSGAEGRRVAKALGVPPGKDLRIAVTGRTPTGRASRVRISSGGVSRELQAAEFRKAAGYAKVRSLKMEIVPVAGEWRITGEGWGHGVGMCQFGANGMARRGAGFREILARYYPGTELEGETP